MKTMMWMRGRTLWKQQRGLTLFELLGVLIIVGIIAAIAVPAIAGVISQSEIDSDNRTEERIANAAELYLNARDNDGDCKLDSNPNVSLVLPAPTGTTPATEHLPGANVTTNIQVTCTKTTNLAALSPVVTAATTSAANYWYSITGVPTNTEITAQSIISVKFLADQQYFKDIPRRQETDQNYYTVVAVYRKLSGKSTGVWVVPDSKTNKLATSSQMASLIDTTKSSRVVSDVGYTAGATAKTDGVIYTLSGTPAVATGKKFR